MFTRQNRCTVCKKEIKITTGPLWKNLGYPNHCDSCYRKALQEEVEWTDFIRKDNPFLKIKNIKGKV